MELKTKTILRLLGWIFAFKSMKNEKFDYDELYLKASLFPLEETLPINEDVFNKIMCDTYEYYKEISEKKDKSLKEVKLLAKQLKDESIYENTYKEVESFVEDYENIIINNTLRKFKYQKSILQTLMDKYIHEENYEACSKIRDRIKEL